jgi:hypothetical protein
MPIEPFRSEILQLPDGSGMYWEASGNPKGSRRFIFTVDLVRECRPGIASISIRSGRLDVSGPLQTAWQLHRCWSKSRLIVVETEGHGGAVMWSEFSKAIANFLPASRQE